MSGSAVFSVGVNNLRRLRSVDPVEVKPITILVGRNTSGKSSFLRIFPLLRQSLMTRTRSPLLWYGDFVDLGSFSGAIYQNDESLMLGLKFVFRDLDIRNFSYRADYGESATTYRLGDVGITLSIEKIEDSTNISRIECKMNGITGPIEIYFKGNRLSRVFISGRDVSELFSSYLIQKEAGSIFPDLYVWSRETESNTPPTYIPNLHNLFSKEILAEVRNVMPGNVSIERARRVANDLMNSWPITKHDIVRSISKSTLSLLKDRALKVELGGFDNEVEKIIFVCGVNRIMPSVAAAIESARAIFSESLYISPARARADRYYRYQDLAVSEIDPDGKNFPMFLNALAQNELKGFSDWVKSLYGFGVHLNRSPGHISIEIDADGRRTNVADTGYGISQLLPVLGQIWWARNRRGQRADMTRYSPRLLRRAPDASVLAIEQPELHLHPAHQSLLADALAQDVETSASRGGKKLYYVIETHSEAMINRLGELISKNKLNPNYISILLFEPSYDEERVTNLRKAEYDKNGVLQNWPYGFFSGAVP